MAGSRQDRRIATVSEYAFAFSALLKPNGEILEVDRQALTFWGLAEADVKGRRIWEIGWRLTQDEDASRLRSAVEATAGGRALRHEAAVWDNDRQTTRFSFSLRPIKDQRGRVVLLVANARNLDRRTGESGAAQHTVEAPPDELARAALELIDQGVLLTGGDGRIEFANAAAGALLATDPALLKGEPLSAALRAAGADTQLLDAFLAGSYGATTLRQEITVTPDERRSSLRLSCSALTTTDGPPVGYAVTLRGGAPSLEAPGHGDPLTGLPTRPALLAELDRVLADGGEHAFCYLDLDAFSRVDERFGRGAANRTLAAVAHELRSHARRGDLLVRLGADEFGLLLRNCNLDNARPIADALLHAVQDARAAGLGAPAPQLTASAGLVSLKGVPSASAAVQLAKHACLRAKEAGGNRLEIAASTDTRRRSRPALQTNRLRLVVQPVLALSDDNGPAPAEVLLRVADAAGRLFPPAAFLAQAEHAELAAEVDRWVIAQVFARAAGAGQPGFTVNLSAASVLDPDLPAYIARQRAEHPEAAGRVGFELDESLAFDQPAARRLAETLRQDGFLVGLDNCGAGGRSLDELRDLPFDYLKISGALVSTLTEDPIDGVLVDAINRIGHLSGMRTVAKCVESDAVLAQVRELGLDYAQGYAVAQPARIEQAA